VRGESFVIARHSLAPHLTNRRWAARRFKEIERDADKQRAGTRDPEWIDPRRAGFLALDPPDFLF
jgi:hypothetical protein